MFIIFGVTSRGVKRVLTFIDIGKHGVKIITEVQAMGFEGVLSVSKEIPAVHAIPSIPLFSYKTGDVLD